MITRYCADQGKTVFKIKKENFKSLVSRLKEFAYNNPEAYNYHKNSKKVSTVMGDVRWSPVINSSGDITDVTFCGTYPDEEEILNVFAPYVEAGSFIEMHGEKENWKWCFDGKQCTKIIL